jgi:hypothetical protein
VQWLTVISTSAKHAQKKMLENTVKKTLRKLGRMTENVEKTKSASKLRCKSQKPGEKKTRGVAGRTALLRGPFDLGRSFDSLVNAVTTYPLWRTTMTMTSLSLYAGYAKPATSTTTLTTKF